MKKPKIGLLPLYIALYDKAAPEMRPAVEGFAREVAGLFEKQGLDVIAAPVCAVEPEFKAAVASFEEGGADAIVTLHLAYSPSLESAAVLAATKLPILILNTTPTLSFVPTIEAGDGISYNHGIHGVQDMANLLIRNGKRFRIFTDHYIYSTVIERVANAAKAAAAAHALRGTKVGMIGEPFAGMGDFDCGAEGYEALGIETVSCKGLRPDLVSDSDIATEYELDKSRAEIRCSYEEYAKTERVGLAVRRWLEDEGIGGFTMNFLSAGTLPGFDTMPFTEASKAMARGNGYAGEGDMLTAALCAPLHRSFKHTTFMEMFCPDWAGNHIFFSHMGELNLNVMERRHIVMRSFKYADCFEPTTMYGIFRQGRATVVNLAPIGPGKFRLILASGRMIDLPDNIGGFENTIAGWFRPNIGVNKLLEQYSIAGGTHHSALVYGASAEELSVFADELGIESVVIC